MLNNLALQFFFTTVQLYCKMKHYIFFLAMHLLKANINIKYIGLFSNDYTTVDAQC